MASDLVSVAAALYALTPDEFTSARGELAKTARAEGDRALASAIGRLRKPTAAAWLVNMLGGHRRDLVDEVVSLGRRLRQAQKRLDGPEMRRLGRQRQELIRRVGAEASALATELGSAASPAVLEDVSESFQAAVTDAAAAAAVRSGLLTKALSAAVTPADLAGALALPDVVELPAEVEAPESPADESSTPPTRREAERARKQHERAERAVQSARELLDERTGLVEASRVRRAELEQQLERLQQELDDLQDALADLDRDLRGLERDRRTAARELQDAERAAADLREN